MKKWILVVLTVVTIGLMAASYYVTWSMAKRSDEDRLRLEQALGQLSRSSYRADSLDRALMAYSKHELIVRTLSSRDQAIDTLKGWIGKDVLLYDSTVAICQGVYFGGDPFEYRVWCRVVKRSDGSQLDVSPLLLRRPR